jgi:hypothetical protein
LPNGTTPGFSLNDALKKFQGGGVAAPAVKKPETPKLEPTPATAKPQAAAKPVFNLTDTIKKFQPAKATPQTQPTVRVGRRIQPYIPAPELGAPPQPKKGMLRAVYDWIGQKDDQYHSWVAEKIKNAEDVYNWNKISLFTLTVLSQRPYFFSEQKKKLQEAVAAGNKLPVSQLGIGLRASFENLAVTATDPVFIALTLAGPLGILEKVGMAIPFVRSAADLLFAGFMTYGAGQRLASSYVHFENGETGEGYADLLDAGINAGFSYGTLRGAIHQTRSGFAMRTFDRLANDTYKKPWIDLPAAQRNEIAGRAIEGAKRNADTLRAIQQAENNRDLKALLKAYEKISGKRMSAEERSRMRGIEPAPTERIAPEIEKLKDAEFEGFLWDAEQEQNKKLWQKYWDAKRKGTIPMAGDIVNENLRTNAQRAELFEQLARGEQDLQRRIYEDAKKTDEQHAAFRRDLDAREARLRDKLRTERARFPRISPAAQPWEPPVKRPFEEPPTELPVTTTPQPEGLLEAQPTRLAEGELPPSPQQVGEDRLALHNLVDHVNDLLESVRRPRTREEIEEEAARQTDVFRGRRAFQEPSLYIEGRPDRPLPTVAARLERVGKAREDLRGVTGEMKYRLENIRHQIELIEGGHRRPTDAEELERLKKEYYEEEYKITAEAAEKEEARLAKERGFTVRGRREFEESGTVLDVTPAHEEKLGIIDRLHKVESLDEVRRIVQEQTDALVEAQSLIPMDAVKDAKTQETIDKAQKAIHAIDKQREEILDEIPEEERPDVDRDKPAATIPQESLGSVGQIKTARGYTVPFQWAVIDIRAVQASHDTDMRVNPMYPARIQPRDRTRAASAAQRDEIAGNLDPNQLGENFSGNSGAPFVGDDLFVEGGNMRAIALKRIYEANSPQAAEYKKWLAENASKFGVNPNAIKMLEKPILVRVRRGTLADQNIDRAQFARDLNEPFEAQMSTVEQAKTDAAMLTDDLMGVLRPSETGSIMTAANQPFITAFFDRVVSPAARGRYMLADGQLSQEGVNRIQNAVFAKAFPGAESILEKLLADPDNNIRNAARAMFQAAPKFAQLQDLINQGVLQDLNISTEIAEAARKLSSLREIGQPVGDYLRTGQMFGPDISETARELLKIFHENARRPANVGDILNAYAEEAMRVGRKDQGTMFGAGEPKRKEDILRGAKNSVVGGSDLFAGGPPADVAEAVPEKGLERPPDTTLEKVMAESKAPMEGIGAEIDDINRRLKDPNITAEEKAMLEKRLEENRKISGEIEAKEREKKPKIVKAEVVPGELPETPKPKKKIPKKFGEKNVIFKKERHDKNVLDIKKMIDDLAKGGTAGMAAGAPPVDPRLVLKLAEEMGYYVEGGIRELADITADLIDRFTEAIRPYIGPAWQKFNEAKGEGGLVEAKAGIDWYAATETKDLFEEKPSGKEIEPTPKTAERGVAANAPAELKEPRGVEPRPVGAAERAKPSGDGESGRRAAGRVAGRPGGRAEERARTIRDVPAAQLEPEVERRTPPAWKPEEWVSGLKEANLPTNARIPTRRLYRHLSDKLIFTGQDLVADYALSELVDGSGGVVIATTTGTGKTYLASSLIRQLQEMNPEAMKNVLILTKNKNLIKDFQQTASNFGVTVEDFPVGRSTPPKNGVFAATYATAIGREGIDEFPWDLVVADESGEARNWWVSKQGTLVKNAGEKAAKMIYMSATPFHNAVEVGYLSKLNLWKKGTFEDWVGQFGVRKDYQTGEWRGHSNPRKVEKLRQQLMERGQFINWDRNMDGFHSSFAVAPVSPENMQKIHDTARGYRMVEEYYSKKGSGKMVMATRGNAVGFMKHLIETFRVPEAIEMAQKARKQGWQVIIFSERRSPVEELYNFMQQADMAYNGEVSRLVPKVPGISKMLRDAIGEDLAVYTGEKKVAERREELQDFIDGKKGVLYSTYGAGGIGVSMHDQTGTRPRVAIYLGPPWSGVTFDQAIGRPWRFGTKSNVHAVFLFSNTAPEVKLVAGKILPRMQSLRAIISGIEKADPIVSQLQDIDKVLAYEHGQEQKNPVEEFTNTIGSLKGFKSHKEVSIPDASTAMYQGIQIKIRKTAGIEEPPKKRAEEGGATLYSGLPFFDPKVFKKYILDDITKIFTGKVEQNVSEVDRGNAVVDRIAREIFDSPAFVRNSASKLGTTENEAKFVRSVGDLAADAAARTSGDPIPVIKNTLEEAAGWLEHFAGVRDVAETGGRAGRAFENIYDWYLGSSGRGLIQKIASKAGSPEIGNEIVSNIMEYQTLQGNTAGPWELRTRDILQKYNIKDKDFEHLWNVVESEEAPRHPDFEKAANELRALNREVQQAVVREGVTLEIFDRATGRPRYVPFPKDPKPFYMPRIYDEEVFQHGAKKREQILEMLMKKHGISRFEAELMLDRKNNRETPLVGNIERAREFDVEGYEKTAHAYMKYLEGAAEVIARSRVFGQFRGKLNEKVSRINSMEGRRDVNEILDTLLARNHFMKGPRDLVRFASDWTSIMKMPFSAIKMIAHLPKAAVVTNTRSFARALEKVVTDYPQAYREAIESGAALHQFRVDMLRDYGVNQNIGGRILRLYQVPEVDILGRVLSDQTARQYMIHYALPDLIQNPQSFYRRMLKEHLILTDAEIDRAIENKEWDKASLNKAGNRLAAKSQGTWDPTELPVGWRAVPKDKAGQLLAAMVRTSTMLKGYIYKNGVFFRDMLWNETRKGNFRPLIPFVVIFPVLGELIEDLTQAARGNPKRFEELFDAGTYEPVKVVKRLLEDASFTTATNLATGFLDTVSRFKGNEVTAVFRFAAGPLASDFATGVADLVRSFEYGFDGRWDKVLNTWKSFGRSASPLFRTGQALLTSADQQFGKPDYSLEPVPIQQAPSSSGQEDQYQIEPVPIQ